MTHSKIRLWVRISSIESINHQVEVFRGSCRRSPWRFYCQSSQLRRAAERIVGVMRRMTTVLTMAARCRVDSFHVLIKDSPVTVLSCASIVFVVQGNACSAAAIGGGRPLGSFDELLPITVLNGSWWKLLMADL